MSQIARCCLCDKRVRIPDVESSDWVRCPHCHEEYQLKKIANDLPPRLQVIGDRPVIIDSASIGVESSTAGKPVNFTGLAESFVHEESGSAPIPKVIGDHWPDEDANEQPDDREPRARVRSPQTLHANRSKRNASGFATMAKVVVGGIVGLLLGQCILWWLPAPYQSDPLNLARIVPARMQFIVPPKLRGQAELPATEATVALKVAEEIEEPVQAQQTTDENARRVPATDLKYSLQTARQENQAFRDRSTHEQRHIDSWYGGLKQLAFCVTNISAMDGVNLQIVEEMTEFLQTLVQDTGKVSLLSQEAAKQLAADPLRAHEGIVLVGEAQGIRSAGELYRTTLRAESGAEVEIVSRQDPRSSKSFDTGDFVLVLGVVVAQPMEIQGYKGPNEAVVLGGFPVKVSKSR